MNDPDGGGGDPPAAMAAATGVHRWSNGPDAVYDEHQHDYAKILVCAEGSIVFTTPAGRMPLAPGDRLDLPAHTPHSAVVGPAGVTCWEGRAPAI